MHVKRVFCAPWPLFSAKSNLNLHIIHADWRFVMTGRYDFHFFESQKVNKPLILLGMVRDRGFEPLTPSVSRKCSTTELTALPESTQHPTKTLCQQADFVGRSSTNYMN